MAVDPRIALAKEFGVPKERIVIGKVALARMLGVKKETVGVWEGIKPAALPHLRMGQANPRVDWVYDVAAVSEWRIKCAYDGGFEDGQRAAPSAGAERVVDPETGEEVFVDEDDISEDEANRQTAIYNLRLKRFEYDVKSGAVSYNDQVETHLGSILRNISENLNSLASKLVAKLIRSGWARVEAEREVKEPIFAMIEDCQGFDFTKDPAEIDSAAAKTDQFDDKKRKDGDGEAETTEAA